MVVKSTLIVVTLTSTRNVIDLDQCLHPGSAHVSRLLQIMCNVSRCLLIGLFPVSYRAPSSQRLSYLGPARSMQHGGVLAEGCAPSS